MDEHPSSRSHRAHLMARIGLAGAFIVAVGLPAGCSSASATKDQFQGPYAAAFREAYDNEKDPASKAALSDGKVSRAEYEDAYQRYKSCMKDRGFTVEVIDDGYGFYVTSFSLVPGVDSASDECSAIHDNVSNLYETAITNPQNEDLDELMVRCLKAQGLVDASYTVKRYEADREANGYVSNGDGEQISKPRNSGASTSPFNLDDPKVRDCHGNPQTALKGK